MATTIKVLTATDLHQVRSLYQGLAEAVKLQRPDVLALIGDLLDMVGGVDERLTVGECAHFLP